MTDEDEREESEAERVRGLLAEGTPDFQVSRALGDRALADAAKRRTRVRAALGGAGVVVIAAGVVAVVSSAGWGGHGHGAASPAAVADAGTSGVTSPTVAVSSSPTASTAHSVPQVQSQSTITPSPPEFASMPKQKAVERVIAALQSGHANSYMGVGFSGVDYAKGTFALASVYDNSPIVVYRKPAGDATFESVAIAAAAPYTVVFRDTVLDASEQWYLGNRIQQDLPYWKGQGVQFNTALQMDGTITISAADPAKVVPLLEQHYGYDGRVFVGRAPASGAEAYSAP